MHGRLLRSLRFGRYQVSDSFGLGQVHPAIQERAPGKLAGLRRQRPGLHAKRYHALQDVCGTMTGNLYDIFTGLGIRGSEQGNHDLVHQLPGAGAAINDTAEMQGMRRLLHKALSRKKLIYNPD
jgi:hypothetical protein